MIIEVKDEDKIQDSNILIDKTNSFFYYKNYIKPKINYDLLKGEILNNLPKVKTNIKDLYIYIRSGDIFINPHPLYSQAPLCFYKNIINNYKFRNIYIIAEDKNNPVIDKLLIQYSNIIYNKNPLNIDIAYLINSYNLVGGKITTFINNIIPLNSKLKYLWIFKFELKKPENDKINYSNKVNKINIFEMYSSKYYLKEMNFWENNQFQRYLMINEKCINKFYLNGNDII